MQDMFREILYIVITLIIPILTKYSVSYVQTVIDAKKDEKNAKYVMDAVGVITSVVAEVSQTYVDSLKKAGQFNSATGEEAKARALVKAKELISEESKKAIEAMYTNYDAWLDTSIEAMVRQQKKQ